MSKVKRTPKFVPFWLWSNWTSIGTGTRAEDRRTVLELMMAVEQKRLLDSRLNYGHGPLDPSKIPLLEANLEYSQQVDDCPWPVSSMFPISDRVRMILEQAAPGNCQFFPIKLWHNRAPSDLVYWALYVGSIDCADPEKSERDSDASIVTPVIIEGRVPHATHIFRVLHDPTKNFAGSDILVRDGLRRILLREKVTGCFFSEPPKPRPPWIEVWLCNRHKPDALRSLSVLMGEIKLTSPDPGFASFVEITDQFLLDTSTGPGFAFDSVMVRSFHIARIIPSVCRVREDFFKVSVSFNLNTVPQEQWEGLHGMLRVLCADLACATPAFRVVCGVGPLSLAGSETSPSDPRRLLFDSNGPALAAITLSGIQLGSQ